MGSTKSFSARLSLNIILIVSILFIIALTVVAISSHLIILDEATKSAHSLLDASIADIEKSIQAVEISTHSGTFVAKEKLNDDKYVRHIIETVVTKNPYIIGATIAFAEGAHKGDQWYAPYISTDSTGQIQAIQFEEEGYDYFYTDWFQIPYMLKKPVWSEPYYDDGGANNFITTYSYPILDEQNNVIAIMTADIALDAIARKISTIKPYPHSHTILISRTGAYVNANNENGLLGETIISTALENGDEDILNASKAILSGNYGTEHVYQDGKSSFIVHGPLCNGWSAAIICEYRDVLKHSSQMHMILIVIGLIGLLIMFIICYSIIRRITKPIRLLSETALNMAKGDINAKLPEIKSQDELMRLRNSFATLQESINNYIDKLQKTTAANERMESELNVAQNIQMGMLPQNFPSQLHALLEPAKEVGGDLYDFLQRDNKIYFAIGDVSGKGVPAALMMAITKSAFHFYSRQDIGMNEILQRVNKAISEANKNDMFVTFFAGMIDLTTGMMEYCNGGHNPIIVVPPDEEPYYLHAKANLALGLFDTFTYTDESLHLSKGTRLILYTDGVSEAERADSQQYGDDRLLQWAKDNARNITTADGEKSEKIVVEKLYASVKEFTDGNAANDDITIMSIIF